MINRRCALRLSFGLCALNPLFAHSLNAPQPDQDRQELARAIDELQAAISPGHAAVWDKWIDPTCIFVDENGTIMDKKAMVADIQPHPPEVYADIPAKNLSIRMNGDVAVLTYDADEHETYYGQKLHAVYRSVFTWLRRSEGWRMIGGQTMALLQEPPAIKLSEAEMRQYVGHYHVSPQVVYAINFEGGHLQGGRVGRTATPLKTELKDVLFSPANLRVRKIFQRNERGDVTGFVDRREGEDVQWKRVTAVTAAGGNDK